MRAIRRTIGSSLIALGTLGAVNDALDFLSMRWIERNAWVNFENLAFCAVWALLILTGFRMWRQPKAAMPARH